MLGSESFTTAKAATEVTPNEAPKPKVEFRYFNYMWSRSHVKLHVKTLVQGRRQYLET